MHLKEYFPDGFEPRKNQEYILNELHKAIENDKKFIIISAPTGLGKSHISATIANYSDEPSQLFVDLVDNNEILKKNVYDQYINMDLIERLPLFGTSVLTTTKALQDQYKQIFNNSTILKGKQNYICRTDDTFDCSLAPCTALPSLMKKCIASNICSYHNSRNNVLKSKFSIMNYSVYLNLPSFVRKKQYLVCDEASELEDELVKHFSCTIEYAKLKFKNKEIVKLLDSNSNNVYAWLNDLMFNVSDELSSLISKITKSFKKDELKTVDYNRIANYKFLKNLNDSLHIIIDNWNSTEFIVEFDAKKVSITPLYIDSIASMIFNDAKHVILMSATIIDHATFAKTLGIKDYVYIEAESQFDSKKSPIYCLNKIKINYSNLDRCLPVLLDYVVKICEKYKNERGIIHTHTNKITQFLKENLNDSRFLFRDDMSNNEQILLEHKNNNSNTVLVSPSLTHGIDLSDDLSRFQIIMKTPYLPLGNKRIKTLFEKDKIWYEFKTLTSLIQMCGRSTRNEDDYADTYILDGCVIELIIKNKHKLSKYFIDRIN